jgi:hypothetical protein
MCIGRSWTRSLVHDACDLLTKSDLFLPLSAPGGMVEYRRALAASFFFKFFLKTCSQILPVAIEDKERSAIQTKLRPASKGSQVYMETKLALSGSY